MRTPKVLLSSKLRRGSVIVYVTLALVVLLGAAGLSIDVGNLYLQRDRAQRAADAAALAAAIQLMNNGTDAAAKAAAERVAAENGYDIAAGATVTCTPDANGNATWYKVYVAKPAPVFFMAIFGWRYKTVGAPATATFETAVAIDINGGGVYGANGPISLSLFGPLGRRANGDRYSTIYIDNHNPRTPNPFYDSVGQYGYDFNISIPEDYEDINGTSTVTVEIFDPDCHNINNNQNAQAGVSVDEMRNHGGGNTSNTDYLTTTRYTLYDTQGTADTSDDTLIASQQYGNDASTDMKWVTPDNFSFDLSDLAGSGAKNVRLNIKSIDGSSENGFNLRAGPPMPAYERVEWNGDWYYKWDNEWHNNPPPFNSNNGTGITATGRIPMNFNAPGNATITLGYVPANATSVIITKFDTDVGAQSVTYSDGTNTWTGVLSSNGTARTDTYDLGPNYPGGNWTATYSASTGDTSVWDMFCTGVSLNAGSVHLVR